MNGYENGLGKGFEEAKKEEEEEESEFSYHRPTPRKAAHRRHQSLAADIFSGSSSPMDIPNRTNSMPVPQIVHPGPSSSPYTMDSNGYVLQSDGFESVNLTAGNKRHSLNEATVLGSSPYGPASSVPRFSRTPPPPVHMSDAQSKRSSWYAGSSPTAPSFVMAPPLGPPRAVSPRPRDTFLTPEQPVNLSPPAPAPLSSSPPTKTPSNPFNFQSKTLTPSESPVPSSSPITATTKSRKGHRYKHSSVSMNFFQEPPKRAPLAIPASLPIPNFTEWYQSMARDQRIRFGWCACHFFVAVLVYNIDLPFTAISALAHLLFYDAMGATLCAAVDVLSNFDVWKQASIHHPFGLERIEVLAGFALAISLVFMGGDIMSHAIQDVAAFFYTSGHTHAHHGHSHGGENDPAIEGFSSLVFRVILALVVTIVSAIGLDNHSRIARTMRRQYDADPYAKLSLPSVLSNPSHLMTVTFSLAVLLFPVMGPSGYTLIDTVLTPIIAGSMCYVGWGLAKTLGGMLVMSYSGPDNIEEIETEIRRNPLVTSVSCVSFWQVHHELWLASMKVVMTGTEDDEMLLRKEAADIVRDIMSGTKLDKTAEAKKRHRRSSSVSGKNVPSNTTGSVRWETTVDITRTTLQD
ncbi:hypothetical protein TRVA0_030S01662 [Trichomonascus vanleenenianus]|uniref:Zn(2+) transporter ZRG17 n=1 Tax=Trichomonascus vanleenenianus TaxID=2268995 RepID=UPI003ECAB7BD